MKGGSKVPVKKVPEKPAVDEEFESFDAFVQEYVTNISRTGAFIKSKTPLPLGTIVNLRFTVSVPQLLAELHGLTREPVLINQNAYYDERYPTGLLSPAVATARFDVTGVGSGPGV